MNGARFERDGIYFFVDTAHVVFVVNEVALGVVYVTKLTLQLQFVMGSCSTIETDSHRLCLRLCVCLSHQEIFLRIISLSLLAHDSWRTFP